MVMLGQSHSDASAYGVQEPLGTRRKRLDPREEAEHKIAAMRAIMIYADSRKPKPISLAKACAAYSQLAELTKEHFDGILAAPHNEQAHEKLAQAFEVSEQTLLATGPIAYRTMKTWRRKFKRHKLAGLIRLPGNRAGTALMDSDTDLFGLVMAELREHHLLSAAQLHATMRQKFPEKQIPSTGRFRLWLTKWKRTHPQDWERLKNPRRLVSRFMPAFGNKDDEVTRPGQIVEIDISPCDLLCLDGRHYLIVAIDVHTRRWVAMIARNPSADAVLACLRKFCRTICVPEMVRSDNGSEFKSHRFRNACANLEIDIDFVAPFSGWLKPYVERVIGTIQHKFFPMLPGAIGANVAERSAIEATQDFAKRLGQTRNERFEVKLSAFETQDRLDSFNLKQMDCPHDGLGGQTPNDATRAAVATGWQARRIGDRELDVLCMDGGVRTVGKKGIKFDRLEFWHDDLVPFLGLQVRILLGDDFGEIHVFAGDNRFVCTAINPERKGVDRREMAISARSAWRAYQRNARKRDRALKAKFTPAKVLDAMTASREVGAPPLTPIELHDVAMLDGAADAIAAGKKNRATAGPRVQTASDSERRWAEYKRIRDTPPEARCDDEAQFLRVFESTAAFKVRVKSEAAA